MGENPPARSEPNDIEGSGVYRKILAKNSGVCMEASYGVGLNLGCGKVKWDGWINVDFENADICTDLRTLPFDDNYADAIAAIHVLEHFYVWDVPKLLQEWKRVLKDDGKLILELPCMDKVIKYMMDCVVNDEPMLEGFTWFAFWGDPRHESIEMTHKWGYSISSIIDLLENNGFKNVRIEKPNYHFPQRDMRVTCTK